MVSYTSRTNTDYLDPSALYLAESPVEASEMLSKPLTRQSEKLQRWLIFAVSIVLVSIPVFVQAPLVRLFPWVSLVLTAAWLIIGLKLLDHQTQSRWGDLLVGFTWTWLAGSVYWGWLRWEPLWHLPIEAIGLPFALWGVANSKGKIGNFFYFGSLFGTVVTDIYFYIVKLIPYWRQLMQVDGLDSKAVQPIFQSALAQIQTPWGAGWAIVLALVLLIAGILPLFSRQLHWWAFSGAVLSTILVDSLFWVAAIAA